MFCLHSHRLPVVPQSSIADSMVSLTSALIAASSSLGTCRTISSWTWRSILVLYAPLSSAWSKVDHGNFQDVCCRSLDRWVDSCPLRKASNIEVAGELISGISRRRLKRGLHIAFVTRFPYHSLHIVLDARVAFEVGLNVGLGFFRLIPRLLDSPKSEIP